MSPWWTGISPEARTLIVPIGPALTWMKVSAPRCSATPTSPFQAPSLGVVATEMCSGGRRWSGAVLRRLGAVDEVHRRRADEAGDEQVRRACGRARAASRPARSLPAFSTTILSAMRHRLDLVVGDVDHRGAELLVQLGDLEPHVCRAAPRRGWRAARRRGSAWAGGRWRGRWRRAGAGRPRAGRACARGSRSGSGCAAASSTFLSISALSSPAMLAARRRCCCARVMCG